MNGDLTAVAAAVRAVAQALPVAALTSAADRLEHATTLLSQAGEGSSNPEMVEAIARMSRAHSMTLDLLRVCETAQVRLLDVAARIMSPPVGGALRVEERRPAPRHRGGRRGPSGSSEPDRNYPAGYGAHKPKAGGSAPTRTPP